MKNISNFPCWRYLTLALILLGLILLPENWAELLAYKREAIIAGEWWRLWSGHFVHFTAMHAFVNCTLLLLLSALLMRAYSWKLVWGLLLLGSPVISLALICFAPEMVSYRGASALAALVMALLISHTLSHVRRTAAYFLYALIIAWLAKLSIEATGGINFSDLPPAVHVAWQAHVAGILIGITVSFSFQSYRNLA